MIPEPRADAPGPRRSAWLRVAGVVISILSLAAVVWWASRQDPPSLPSGTGQWAALGGALLAYALATALRSERWLALLRRAGTRPPRADAYALTLVGFMGNNVLPARGGDAFRAVLMAPRASTSIRGVVGTLVAERVLDVAFLLSLFCLLAYGVLRGIDAPSGAAVAIVFAALGFGVLALLAARSLARRGERSRRVVDFLEPVAAATRRLRGRHALAMLVATAGIWTAEAATYLFAGLAAGLDIEVLEALYLVALASVFVLIPSGPGYAGTLDAGVLFGANAIGADGSLAISFLLMLRFVLLVPITVAGAVALVSRYGWRPGSGGGSTLTSPRAA